MKTRPKSNADSTTQTAIPQGQLPPELGPIAELLKFTPRQALALDLIAEWEGETVQNFIHSAVLKHIERSFDFMACFSKNTKGWQSRRAQKILTLTNPVF